MIFVVDVIVVVVVVVVMVVIILGETFRNTLDIA